MFREKAVLRILNVAALAAAIPCQATGQAAPPPPPGAPPPPPSWVATSPIGAPKTFEVASVKLNKSGNLSGGMRYGPGSLTLSNTTLEGLVSWAYSMQDFQIVDAPRWFRSERYDVAAKAHGAPDVGHLKLLLQELLADRFKLRVHHETRSLPVFVLTLEASRGLKMKPSVGPALPDAPQLTGRNNAIHSELTGQHATMTQLASSLTRHLGRPVIDKTGLKGGFDFKLAWTPDENQVGRTIPAYAPASSQQDPTGISIFTAVRDQLGLKLESQKGPGDILLIDHAERIPTEN
jgi:uncharacterized protein (TIGR03435 family)